MITFSTEDDWENLEIKFCDNSCNSSNNSDIREMLLLRELFFDWSFYRFTWKNTCLNLRGKGTSCCLILTRISIENNFVIILAVWNLWIIKTCLNLARSTGKHNPFNTSLKQYKGQLPYWGLHLPFMDLPLFVIIWEPNGDLSTGILFVFFSFSANIK